MINYHNLAKSVDFYAERGFERLEAPWWVSPETMKITAPPGHHEDYFIPINQKCLVASGEQSFLYMMLKERLPAGGYQTVTPCFRNESIGALSKKTFIKNELIQTKDVTPENLKRIIDICFDFFASVVPMKSKLEIIQTGDTPENGVDIYYSGVELGSYGIRSHLFLDWIYATGCAEPRLSRAVEKEVADLKLQTKKPVSDRWAPGHAISGLQYQAAPVGTFVRNNLEWFCKFRDGTWRDKMGISYRLESARIIIERPHDAYNYV